MKEELLGTEDRGVAAALHEIAILYQKQERYSDAEDLLKRVLLMEEKVLGNGHLDVAVTLENLSSTYMLQGKYKETYPYLERAIDIFKSIMGAEHVALLGVLLQMAVVNEKLGDYKKATLYYGKFLAIGQKEQALKKEQVVSILLNVSNTFIEQNMLKEAEKSILQLISLEDYVKEENRSEYIIALNNLGCVYLQQGKPDMANQIYRRVADMLGNMPDLENLEMSQIIANIGSSYILLDQYEQALPFIEEALRIRLQFRT
jgi:tetratricopeptide (TPR) repeat protein